MENQNDPNPETIRDFFDCIHKDYMDGSVGKVGYKFLADMLDGIQKTRSVNLTTIARGLSESIRLHATHKRLSRNLDDEEILSAFSSAVLSRGASHVKSDTRLIVTMHELNKKYASKIQYLSGSEEEHQCLGFKVCEILASDYQSDVYYPIFTRVWSDQVPDYEDDAKEVLKTIKIVLKHTNNKGICYLDDLSLSPEVTTQIILESDFDFISLANNVNSKIEYEGHQYSASDLAEKLDTRFGKMMYKLIPRIQSNPPSESNLYSVDMDLFVHAGAFKVNLKETGRKLQLITLKTKNRFVGELSIPVLTTVNNLKSRKNLMGLVESLMSKNDVVLTHRHYKNEFDLSGFRVLKFSRLNLLVTLVQTVMFYEMLVGINSLKEISLFSTTPHEGNLERTYYRPEGADKT